MSLRAIEPDSESHAAVGSGQHLSVQFENLDQQNETYLVGMWSFLVTEIMFFGGLFMAYTLYRVMYFDVYLEAHQFLMQHGWFGMAVPFPWLGTVNTMVLLSSSLFMVLAVYHGQHGNRGKTIAWLSAVVVCAFAFMGVKYVEYTNKLHEGLFPDRNFNYARALYLLHEEEHAAEHGGEHANRAWTALKAAQAGGAKLTQEGIEPPSTFTTKPEVAFDQRLTSVNNGNTAIAAAVPSVEYTHYLTQALHARLFFSIYFSMTGLHGIHVSIGILMMGLLIVFYLQKHPCVDDYMPLEMIGLYWHFVDIVWIFLFPLMYLIS